MDGLWRDVGKVRKSWTRRRKFISVRLISRDCIPVLSEEFVLIMQNWYNGKGREKSKESGVEIFLLCEIHLSLQNLVFPTANMGVGCEWQ